MLKEFNEFAMKGNVVDMAIGVIIGAATSLMLQVGSAQVMYGNFIQAVINFLVIAFVLFLIVRQLNRMKKQQPATPAAPSAEEKLLTEIRDLLKRR